MNCGGNINTTNKQELSQVTDNKNKSYHLIETLYGDEKSGRPFHKSRLEGETD